MNTSPISAPIRYSMPILILFQNKLKREDAFSRLNLAKINLEWRTILRNVKCNELRNELKSIQKYFQDALMRKNQTIDRLLFELDESEEMYATLMHSHMESVERLICEYLSVGE